MNSFKKIFVGTMIFTASMWSMAWVFSAVAGETPKSTIKKLQGRLNEGQLVEEKEILDLKGIDTVTVETSSTDIVAEATTGDIATAEFSGTVSKGGKMIQLERKGSELFVRLDQNRGARGLVWSFGDDDDSLGADIKVSTFQGLKITLPANVIKNLKVKASSGDVRVKNMNTDILEARASSGDVTVSNCTARTVGGVETSSGDIDIDGFNGKLRASSTSGQIEAQRISGDEFETTSTSGDIEIKEIKTLGLRAQATSGDISVTMPEAAGWKFSLSATSGDIKNDFSDDAAAEKIMQIQSTSGDIRVRR